MEMREEVISGSVLSFAALFTMLFGGYMIVFGNDDISIIIGVFLYSFSLLVIISGVRRTKTDVYMKRRHV